jgi:hypothetical protein
VVQKRGTLYFVAYEPTTCARYRLSLEEGVQKPMIRDFRACSAVERTVQLMSMLERLCFVDRVGEGGALETVLDFYEGERKVDVKGEISEFTAGLDDLMEAMAAELKSLSKASKKEEKRPSVVYEPKSPAASPKPKTKATPGRRKSVEQQEEEELLLLDDEPPPDDALGD